jgi:hypothetical protein
MTPFSSVAMLEKLALFNMAFCKRPCLEQGCFAPDLSDDIHRAKGILENGRIAVLLRHIPTSVDLTGADGDCLLRHDSCQRCHLLSRLAR